MSSIMVQHHLKFAKKVDKIYNCDMLENRLEEKEVRDNTLSMELKPFEIVTLAIS